MIGWKKRKTELSEHEDVCLLTPGGFANELLIWKCIELHIIMIDVAE